MIKTNTTSSPYVPPDFFMARVVNPVLRFIGAPTLTVRGRRSGLPITTPLAPFDYEGARYLVGGGGDTHWIPVDLDLAAHRLETLSWVEDLTG